MSLTIDDCLEGQVPDPDMSEVADRTRCQSSGVTPGENRFLNMATLLELGGRYRSDAWWPSEIPPHGMYKGCVKNLKHNGEVSEGVGLLPSLYIYFILCERALCKVRGSSLTTLG